MAQQFDVAAKLLLGRPRSALFPRLFGGPVIHWHNVELPRIENKRSDLVGETASGELTYLEVDTGNDPEELPRRTCRNFILMEDRFPGRIVVPVVLYIGRGPMKFQPPYQSNRLWFDYVVLDMRREDGAELLASDDIEDNMLALLTDTVDKKGVITRVMEKLAEIEGRRREDMALLFIILGGLRDLEKEIIERVEAMITMTDLLQNQVLGPALRDRFAAGEEKGREQGLREGIQEGLREGLQEGRRDLLLKLLRARFGPITDSIRDRIASANEAQLSDWGVRFLSIDRIEDLFSETD